MTNFDDVPGKNKKSTVQIWIQSQEHLYKISIICASGQTETRRNCKTKFIMKILKISRNTSVICRMSTKILHIENLEKMTIIDRV